MGKGGTLDDGVVDVFRYRCRNFVDSGVIGSREFVEEVVGKVRKPVEAGKKRAVHGFKGIEGVCSMKRLVG
jgi:hypothetical protein